jgi:hypothetical protein
MPANRDTRQPERPPAAPRATAHHPAAYQVMLPEEPPHLTPGAAAPLLRILLKAYKELIDEGVAQ